MQELPTKLLELYNETYVQKLESRPKSEQILTKNALRMLLCLQIPLRTGDFMLALCSCEEANLSAEGLVDLCSSFVVLDTGLDIFRFAHLSVREFLETKSDYEPDKNHALVAELCLRYFPNDIVTQSAETWNNEQAGSEWDPQKDGSSSVVLVHKHPSKAPAACERMIFGMGCKSCGQGKDSIMWDCATIEGPTLYFCGDCVKKGRICKYEHHCPLTISLLYGGTEHSIPKEAFDENDHIYADAPISTLSTVPIFLDGFHQYSCFYWPFHLRESSGHRLSSPLQSISIDFMIGHQQTASASFVSWNNTMLRAIRAPDRTWGYDLFAHRAKAVCDGVSQPADCIFIATIWGFSNILELRVDINPNNVNNVSQREGSPALHLASGHGNLRAAQILLEKGAMLEDRNCHGYNALDIAVQNQRPEIVNLLLERGADARFKQGALYPLQQAVGLDHLVIIQLLLKYGADPEMGGMIDPSAMILAATKGNEDAMKLLVDYLAGTENSTKSLWKTVTRIQKVMRTEGEAGLLHSLSAWPSGTIANQLLGTVLWVAVMRKEEACARLLLSRRADPNTMIEKKSVFDVAARHLLKGDMRQLKFAETLLAHGARPDIRRYHRSSVENLIGWGVNHNIPDLVRLCADTGANFNKNSLYNPLYYPLYDAVEIRNVEMVRFVLERGADPKDVSARFFSGDIKPRDGDRYSLQGSEVIGDLLLEYGGTR